MCENVSVCVYDHCIVLSSQGQQHTWVELVWFHCLRQCLQATYPIRVALLQHSHQHQERARVGLFECNQQVLLPHRTALDHRRAQRVESIAFVFAVPQVKWSHISFAHTITCLCGSECVFPVWVVGWEEGILLPEQPCSFQIRWLPALSRSFFLEQVPSKRELECVGFSPWCAWIHQILFLCMDSAATQGEETEWARLQVV